MENVSINKPRTSVVVLCSLFLPYITLILIWTKWKYVWVRSTRAILTIILALYSCFSIFVLFSSVNSPASNTNTLFSTSQSEDISSSVRTADTAINGMTESAVSFYDDLLDVMSSSESVTEIYDTANNAAENILKLRSQIKDRNAPGEGGQSYKDAALSYLANCWAFADYVSTYAETGDSEAWENAQRTGQIIPSLKLEYEAAREEYLNAAGLTAD